MVILMLVVGEANRVETTVVQKYLPLKVYVRSMKIKPEFICTYRLRMSVGM